MTTTNITPQAILTTEEVLGYLRVTPRTIYRLIRTGELPAMRIGRQWRFRRSDLDEWLDRQRPASN
jgi:excisionase family DNA binding protein